MSDKVLMGSRIVLMSENGVKIPVLVEKGTHKVAGLGVLDMDHLEGREYGSVVALGARRYLLLRPSILDRVETVRRKAQIILPKDAAVILMNCDIKNGCTVAEAGSGSGALTTALANAVSPDGHVFSMDIRADFLNQAKENIETAGFADVVTFSEMDVCGSEGIRKNGLDAVVLDIPEPWRAIDNAWNALRPCGYFAAYTPTANQVEQTVRALREKKFIAIVSVEVLQREMTVVEKGIRPAFDMLGHSGYLTFARKVLEKL